MSKENKLAVIILDALDSYNIDQLGMENVRGMVRDYNSNVLGVSTLPHTAQSNPMIWGGFHNETKYWVKEPGEAWTDPAAGFDRDEGESKGKAMRVWERRDFTETFVWEELEHQGVDSTALHIPITLPPYNFNLPKDVDSGEDHWFPDTQERMKKHTEVMPEKIKQIADSGRDFIAVSIQMPDKYLHGLGEGKCTEEFVDRDASKLDENISDLITHLESSGYDWVILGDHGSPWPGAIKLYNVKQLLPRHRKESIIISNLDNIPTYTHEIHDFILDYFGKDEVPYKDLGMSYIRQLGNSY